jgi:hypothetical protein
MSGLEDGQRLFSGHGTAALVRLVTAKRKLPCPRRVVTMRGSPKRAASLATEEMTASGLGVLASSTSCSWFQSLLLQGSPVS